MITAFEFDTCYETGEYDDQICDLCPHKEECSGSDIEDDD